MIVGVEPFLPRYELVSRRAVLKATAALSVAMVLPACGNDDERVFAGATAERAEESAAPIATTAPVEPPTVEVEPADRATEVPPTPAPEPTAATEPTAAPEPAAPQLAVAGELLIAFTYTQGPVGKIERPYIAVWIENEANELVDTVALWYQQERRGERWLDHLNRWYPLDQARTASTGIDDTATISSATREPGAYTVAWDGLINGEAATAGRYYVCIESSREDGPDSLICQPLDLAGTLAESPLSDDGELSAASVRISV